jgi:hypothetical protein
VPRLGSLLVSSEESIDGGLQIDDGAEDAAPEAAAAARDLSSVDSLRISVWA